MFTYLCIYWLNYRYVPKILTADSYIEAVFKACAVKRNEPDGIVNLKRVA